MKQIPKKALRRIANTGIGLLVLAWVIGLAETAYFGYNLFPLTLPELLFDLLSACIFVAGASLLGAALLIRSIQMTIEQIEKIKDEPKP